MSGSRSISGLFTPFLRESGEDIDQIEAKIEGKKFFACKPRKPNELTNPSIKILPTNKIGQQTTFQWSPQSNLLEILMVKGNKVF